MQIGIIGGPGSGKSELAQIIQKSYLDYKIVDGYVERLSQETDTAFGPFATMLGSVQVAIERYNEECAAGAENLITCGTILDTMVHMAINADRDAKAKTQDKRATGVAFEFLGSIMLDTFLYDRLFYLTSDEGYDDLINYSLNLYGIKPTRITDRDFSDAVSQLQEYEKEENELKAPAPVE